MRTSYISEILSSVSNAILNVQFAHFRLILNASYLSSCNTTNCTRFTTANLKDVVRSNLRIAAPLKYLSILCPSQANTRQSELDVNSNPCCRSRWSGIDGFRVCGLHYTLETRPEDRNRSVCYSLLRDSVTGEIIGLWFSMVFIRSTVSSIHPREPFSFSILCNRFCSLLKWRLKVSFSFFAGRGSIPRSVTMTIFSMKASKMTESRGILPDNLDSTTIVVSRAFFPRQIDFSRATLRWNGTRATEYLQIGGFTHDQVSRTAIKHMSNKRSRATGVR